MIDAHCHLYSDKYNHDLEKVIKYARERLAAIVVSAIDNLGKGAASQAVQNLNLMNGYSETDGLLSAGLYI